MVLPNNGSTADQPASSGHSHVEVYTERLIVACTLEHGRLRVSDLFNQSDRDFTLVRNASIFALPGRQELGRELECRLNLREVIMAVVQPESGPPSQSEHEERLVKVPKQPHTVRLYAPPFVAQGKVHLPLEANVYDALLISARFVPLTDALVLIDGPSSGTLKADTVLVNRPRIQLIAAVPEAPAQERPVRSLIRSADRRTG